MYGHDNYNKINRGFNDFKVAVYCRLSREDEGFQHSESIINQKEFLLGYIREQGWQLHDVYIDDGYTGSNFDRPGFKRLIGDVEAGRVNLVITKDLSRLGRDYITTGHYLERYFPENKIRYIAVTDGIDTFVNNPGNDISPFRSVINDLYARDISVKVKNAMDTKRKEGKFIGAFPPYGYKKDPNNKNKLIPDEETAPVVERIFHLYSMGWGFSKIANTFNSEGVITPTEYKSRFTAYKGKIKNNLWNHSTIKVILENPTYAGNLRQRVNKRASYKSKKLIRTQAEDWIVVEGTHEAIVEAKMYEEVYKKLNGNKEKFKYGKTLRIFSGKVYCADCGAYMTFNNGKSKNVYLICSTYKRFTSKYCSRHSISEAELTELVIQDIRQMAAGLLDKKSLSGMVHLTSKAEKNSPLKKISQETYQIEAKVRDIDRIIKNLYTDRVNAVITPQQFIELSKGFADEKTTLQRRLESLQMRLAEINQMTKESNYIEEMAEDLLNMKELDRIILEKLVDKIEVSEDQKIKIHYHFTQPVKQKYS